MIVPLHRASIVVVPEKGVKDASTVWIQRLVEEADPSRVVVSLDWVTDCLAWDQLLELETYRIRLPTTAVDDISHQSSRANFRYHRSDLLSIEQEELSRSYGPSQSAQAESPLGTELQHDEALHQESHSYKDSRSTIVLEVADVLISPPTSPQVGIATESMRDLIQRETVSPTSTSRTSDNGPVDFGIRNAADCMYPEGYMDWLRNKYIGWNGPDSRSDLVEDMAQWVCLVSLDQVQEDS